MHKLNKLIRRCTHHSYNKRWFISKHLFRRPSESCPVLGSGNLWWKRQKKTSLRSLHWTRERPSTGFKSNTISVRVTWCNRQGTEWGGLGCLGVAEEWGMADLTRKIQASQGPWEEVPTELKPEGLRKGHPCQVQGRNIPREKGTNAQRKKSTWHAP